MGCVLISWLLRSSLICSALAFSLCYCSAICGRHTHPHLRPHTQESWRLDAAITPNRLSCLSSRLPWQCQVARRQLQPLIWWFLKIKMSFIWGLCRCIIDEKNKKVIRQYKIFCLGFFLSSSREKRAMAMLFATRCIDSMNCSHMHTPTHSHTHAPTQSSETKSMPCKQREPPPC